MFMILLVLIEIPLTLLILASAKFRAWCMGAETEKKAAPAAKEAVAKLSDKQREKIVTAIIEDALLINDAAYDSLMQEGESLYNAAEASKTTNQNFDLQYGSKDWIKAWTVALARWFDCEAEYTESGMFHVFGKEA